MRLHHTCEERDYKELHSFPSNITRDGPPITRDYPSLPSNITREVTHRVLAPARPRRAELPVKDAPQRARHFALALSAVRIELVYQAPPARRKHSQHRESKDEGGRRKDEGRGTRDEEGPRASQPASQPSPSPPQPQPQRLSHQCVSAPYIALFNMRSIIRRARCSVVLKSHVF